MLHLSLRALMETMQISVIFPLQRASVDNLTCVLRSLATNNIAGEDMAALALTITVNYGHQPPSKQQTP